MYLFDALDLAAIDFIQVKMITAAKYVCPKHQTIYIINFNKTVCFYYDSFFLIKFTKHVYFLGIVPVFLNAQIRCVFLFQL